MNCIEVYTFNLFYKYNFGEGERYVNIYKKKIFSDIPNFIEIN